MESFKTQGLDLPRLGLGTYRMQGDVCRAAVESALGLGLSAHRYRRNVCQ